MQLSLKKDTNQQTSDDIDALLKSAGIEGEAIEIREDLAELAKWYTPNNPLYGSGGVKNEMFRQSISDALDFVSDTSRGAFTMEDIDAAEMIFKYFKREIENYGTIYKNGKNQKKFIRMIENPTNL